MLRTSIRLLPSWVLLASSAACAQASPNMTFFVTSSGNGPNGGNYGGLVGADQRCQSLAASAGGGARTWRAYLSTTPHAGMGGVLVHARDRIGNGPWFNFDGIQIAANIAALHANQIDAALIKDETGVVPPGNDHDILTGSKPDGTAWEEFPGNPAAPPPNCFNWTSSSDGAYGFVGHSNWVQGLDNWNSRHDTLCHQAGLNSNGGSGRLYCFAISSDPDPVFRNGFEG